MKQRRILIVDDDLNIQRMLKELLEDEGYLVECAGDGNAGLKFLHQWLPDLVILDLILPGVDGYEVCRLMRLYSNAPIIVLSRRDDDRGKVQAFDNGADDYVTKPLPENEFLARVRAAMRRAYSDEHDERSINIGGLHIDLNGRQARVDDKALALTRTEFALLALLARNANRVLTHDELLMSVWGTEFQGSTHYLHVYLGRVRKKLSGHSELLKTVPGIGYILQPGGAA